MMFNLRGRYPLTLAMLQEEQVKKQEVIGVYRYDTDFGVIFCLQCWERFLLGIATGKEEESELKVKREYITPLNILSFAASEAGELSDYMTCGECGAKMDDETFGIRADLWQCESCGCDVYAYVIGPKTGGKKVCITCYERLTT